MNKPTKYSIALLAILTLSNAGTTDLGEIEIVSANKTKQNIKKTTSNVTVITEDDIRQNGYMSVLDALSKSVGLNISQNGGIGQKSSFFMRGMDSGKILVLIDGMRLNDPSTTNSTSMIEFLPISNVEQIEIIRGGSSSVWGANASAGVINIITKNSTQEGLNGDVSLNYGSHKTKGTDLSLLFKEGKLNAKLLGSYLDTNGISSKAPQNSEKDGYNNKNITAGFGYDFTDKTKASLTVMKTKTKGDYDNNDANDDYSNFITDSTNIIGTISTKIGLVDSIFNISRGNYERGYFSSYVDSYTKQTKYTDDRYEATANEYSLINSYSHSNGKSVLGLEYKDIDGFNQYNTGKPTDGGFTNKGIFLSNSIKPTEKLLVEANIRYDDFNEFDGKTTYKVGAKYDLSQNITFGANYYTSLNAPSVYQLSNILSGETLKPSFAQGYDATISYKRYLSLTYFNNDIKDDFYYIDAVYDANWKIITPGGYKNNSSDEKIKGVELSLNTPYLFDRFVARANYTHLFNAKDASGTPLYNRAKDELNGFIDYDYDDKTLISLNTQYVGQRYSPFGYPTVPKSTGNYTLWNIDITKSFNDSIYFGLHFKNIFDKDYQSVYGYNSEGRSIYADVRYKF